MRNLTVPSSAVALRSDKSLTPAMVSLVWEIAAMLDEQRVPATVANSVWIEAPTSRLRGDGGRDDNFWLRKCLDRLTGVKLSGEYRGEPWGAVVLSQWRITRAGTVAQLLITPAGVQALRNPQNFLKIEARAVHSMTGYGRRLYALLSDKKRLKKSYWVFDLKELRALFGLADNELYKTRFNSFRQNVLDPAIRSINSYGTVSIKMTREKMGRFVVGVRFDWKWKEIEKVISTENLEEEEDLKDIDINPPHFPNRLPPIPEPLSEQEQADLWWRSLSEEERDEWADKVGRYLINKRGEALVVNGKPVPRRDDALALAAFREERSSRDVEKAKPSPERKRGEALVVNGKPVPRRDDALALAAFREERSSRGVEKAKPSPERKRAVSSRRLLKTS